MYLVTCFQGYKDRLWSINSILELKQKLDLAKKKTPRVWFDVRSKFVKSLRQLFLPRIFDPQSL